MSETAKSQEVMAQAESLPQPSSESAALISVIERAASNPEVDIEKMERLMQMHERIQGKRAEAAFYEALSAVQDELPAIAERGRIKDGQGKTRSTYALWEDINEVIKPVLKQHGLALSFQVNTRDGVEVTAVLSHREGHSVSTTIHLPADNSGSKNPVQSVASSVSYGKRYTAGALLNLTSHGEDDDGQTAGAKYITEGQAEILRKLIESTGADEARFLKWAGAESIEQIPASQFDKARSKLEQKARESKQ